MKRDYRLSFQNFHSHWHVNVRQLRPCVEELLEQMGITEAELSWAFVGKRKMAGVNQKYLGHEGSTDVITFQYAQEVRVDSVRGDAYICIDEAFLYAKEFNTTPQSETLRYLIHSILHLQGFDDLEPEARKVMKQHENKWVRWIEAHTDLNTIFLKTKCQS